MTTTSQTRVDPPDQDGEGRDEAGGPADVRESFAAGPDATRLYVRFRRGPGSLCAVLCDGLVCDGFIYKYLWNDLADHCSVAHWNYRGHGRSELPRDATLTTIDDHARDLNAVCEHVGDPPVVLVGHSMGTQVALEAYHQRPERVAGMILLCGSFGRVTHTFKGSDLLATVVPKLLEQVALHPKIARAIWSRLPPKLAVRLALMMGEVDARTIHPEDMEPYFDHAAHVDFELFLKMLRDAGEHSAEAFLADVRVPRPGGCRRERLLHAAGAVYRDGRGASGRRAGHDPRWDPRRSDRAPRAPRASGGELPGAPRGTVTCARPWAAAAVAGVLFGAAASCRSEPERGHRSDVASAPSASVSSPAPRVEASAKQPEVDWAKLGVAERLQRAPLEKITRRERRLEAVLAGGTRAVVHLSTTERPLAHRAPVAYYRVAELVQPGLVLPTVVRSIPLGDLAGAAHDEKTKSHLRRKARVLADGKVRAAIALAPPADAAEVDVADVAPGTTAWSWEKPLMTRDAVPADAGVALAGYETLLIVDYLLGNLRRRRAHRTPDGGLLATHGNDVFSPHDFEGAVKDPIQRLARYTTYPRSTIQRLRALDRARVAKAVDSGRQGEHLVTPKQVDEVIERRNAVLRLVDRRIELRGNAKALALP